jgi:hypothetical protein
MSADTITRDAKLYSIGVFEDRVVRDDPSRPMSLEEYEAYVDENGEFSSHLAAQSADDLGARLNLLGLMADMSEVSMIGKTTFKEFLLAGLRKIAGSHDPRGRVDTYEFDAPKHGTFAAYVQTRDTVTQGVHHRVTALIVTTGSYPKSLKMTVAERILEYSTSVINATPRVDSPRKYIDRRIVKLMREFYTPKKGASIQVMRENLGEITDVMKGNVEKLVVQGDQLDDMVARSTDLSKKSKSVYKKARKLNYSCTIL